MAQNIEIPDFQRLVDDIMINLPGDVATIARTHFLGSFIKEGFTDNSFIAWPKRKDTDVAKILTRSMALRNSIKITTANKDRVEIEAGAGLPYAAIQNSGGTITIKITEKAKRFFWAMYMKTEDEKWKYMALTKKKTLTIAIPQRKYIGHSMKLLEKLDQYLIKKINSMKVPVK